MPLADMSAAARAAVAADVKERVSGVSCRHFGFG
jgi:hypothetical protein